MRLVGYDVKFDTSAVKQGIVKMLTHAEKVRATELRKDYNDDSALQARINIEEIQFVELDTLDRNQQPLSQYVCNEYS